MITPELRQSLAQAPSDVAAFAALWRRQSELLAALPARYSEAMETVLQRLESSASFSEESCSFSQRDLLEALDAWLDRAEKVLG